MVVRLQNFTLGYSVIFRKCLNLLLLDLSAGECSYDQQECPDKTCVAKYYGKCGMYSKKKRLIKKK